MAWALGLVRSKAENDTGLWSFAAGQVGKVRCRLKECGLVPKPSDAGKLLGWLYHASYSEFVVDNINSLVGGH